MDLTGDLASTSLEEAHITCNKNGIPKDPKPPKITSGIRLVLQQQQLEALERR